MLLGVGDTVGVGLGTGVKPVPEVAVGLTPGVGGGSGVDVVVGVTTGRGVATGVCMDTGIWFAAGFFGRSFTICWSVTSL